MAAKITIRLLDNQGVPVTDKQVRIMRKEWDGEAWADATAVTMPHVGNGLYRVERDHTTFGSIQVYDEDTEQWVEQVEAINSLFPSTDIIKHIHHTEGNAHEIGDITGLSVVVDEVGLLETDVDNLQTGLSNHLDGTTKHEASDINTPDLAFTDLHSLLLGILGGNGSTIPISLTTAKTKLDSLIADVSELTPVVVTVKDRSRDVVVTTSIAGSLWGSYQLQYVIRAEEEGAVDWTESLQINASQNWISIQKPSEGDNVYNDGIEGKAYLLFRVRFISAGGSESNWTEMQTNTIDEPELTLDNLVNRMKQSSVLMSELADLVANRVVVETFHAQQQES